MRRLTMLLAFGAALAMTGCAQRNPTVDIPVTNPPPVQDSSDWQDWGPEANKQARENAIEGRRLTTEQIEETFTGRILRGCYPGGTQFSELLAEDGRFFDAGRENAYLGTWSVKNAQLCFLYEEGQTAGRDVCFPVVREPGGAMAFYSADFRNKVASTACAS